MQEKKGKNCGEKKAKLETAKKMMEENIGIETIIKVTGLTKEEILQALNPDNLCGRAPKQVEDFINTSVNPVLEKYGDLIKDITVEVNV